MAELVIDQGFVVGVRKEADQQRNAQALADLLNLAPTERGLKQLPTFTYPYTSPALSGLSHPFPQLFWYQKEEEITAKRHIMLEAAKLYVGSSTGAATQVTTYNPVVVKNVDGVTLVGTDPVKVSTDGAHGFLSGESVTFAGVVGTTELNGQTYTITRVDDDDFTLNGTDSSAFTAYVSGGTATPASTKAIAGSALWHVAVCGDSYFCTNGTSLVYYIPSNASGHTFCATGSWFCRTVLNHRTRLFVAGMAYNKMDNSAWTSTIFPVWLAANPMKETNITDDSQTVDGSWVMWSQNGGGDIGIPYAMFMAALGYPDPATCAKFLEPILQAIEEGEIGLLHCEHTGVILKLMTLGDDIIAYGQQGISKLVPNGPGYIEVPLLDKGIDGRGCAGGDEHEHVFVAEGAVWKLRPGELPDRQGYVEFVGTLMTDASILITFEPERRWYFITDGSKGFVLTHTGAARTELMPTAILGGFIGCADALSTSNTALFKTGILDGGQRGVGELACMRFATTDTGTAGWTGTTDFRFNKGDAFTSGTLTSLDDRGYLWTKTSGIDFQVRGYAADHTKVDLDRLELEFSEGKKRSLRKML